MTTQHKRGIDKGEGFDGAIADIMRPTSHMPTVEASLTSSYIPCKWKMAVCWSLGFVGFIRFHSHEYPSHFDSFRLIPFFFLYPYSEFPIFPLFLIPFILFSIHFYVSSDPLYSESTPHSTPYPGLAEAGSTIPKSGN